jgi:CheY-like chemotaxis protein
MTQDEPTPTTTLSQGGGCDTVIGILLTSVCNIFKPFWSNNHQVIPNPNPNRSIMRSIIQSTPSQHQQRLQETERINAQIKLFFHSVRGPINTTLMGISLLEDMIPRSTPEHTLLENIKYSCTFACETLDKYAGIKKITSNSTSSIKCTMYPFNIDGIFQQVQYLLSISINEKRLRYTLKMQESNICKWVVGDEHNLTHVLLNVLTYCFSQCEPGSRVEVSVSAVSSQMDTQTLTINIVYEGKSPPDDYDEVEWNMNSSILKCHGGTLSVYRDLNVSSTISSSSNLMGINKLIYSLRKTISVVGIKSRKTSKTINCEFTIKLSLKTCNQRYSLARIVHEKKNSTDSLLSRSILPDMSMNFLNTAHKFDSLRRPTCTATTLSTGVNPATQNVIVPSPRNNVVPVSAVHQICVIDDSDMSRKMLIQLIQTTSAKQKIQTVVYQAEDGLDGILKFYQTIQDISIVFLDNIMPTLAGPMTAKLLRALGYNNLIFGVTGNSMEDDIKQFYESGIDHLFTKPFKRPQLDAVWVFIKKYGTARKIGHKIMFKDGGSMVWGEG